ncbi:MAG: Nif3-like dinuclear metal center hexameric protein [Coriobacteriales bacterium]|jgi:putative NIF3 family GTP cyclohydrolase 1 type 2|nr:Nif3-like dinuclear metal center hexameric protein [Coriobacteriales bacterium]
MSTRRTNPTQPNAANTVPPKTVGELVEALFNIFPAADAMPDDRIGLQVGDPAAPVSRVGVALDPTADVVGVAATLGCQALVCHHPAYWFAPQEFVAAGEASLLGGGAAFAAARAGVAVIAMHTNLDAAPRAREMLLAPVGYRYAAPLQLINAEKDAPLVARDPLAHLASLGQLAVPVAAAPAAPEHKRDEEHKRDVPLCAGQQHKGVRPFCAPAVPTAAVAPTLAELAGRCVAAFGAVAKVWGDPELPVAQLAVCSGAGGGVLAEVVAAAADCFLTGELHHHEAIALTAQGIAAIELGHDLSELPYRSYIAAALRETGFAEADIVVLEPSASWWTPDAGAAAATTGLATAQPAAFGTAQVPALGGSFASTPAAAQPAAFATAQVPAPGAPFASAPAATQAAAPADTAGAEAERRGVLSFAEPGRRRLIIAQPFSGQFAPVPSGQTTPLPQVVASFAQTDLGQIDSESGALPGAPAELEGAKRLSSVGWEALIGASQEELTDV